MTTPPNPTSPVPPGWFPIPGNPSQESWWDGRQWTPHVRATQMQSTPKKPHKKPRMGWVWITGISVVGILLIGSFISDLNPSPSSTAVASPSHITVKQVSPEEQAQINAQNKAIADGQAADSANRAESSEQNGMKDKGWSYVSDHLYYIIDPASTVSCGSTPCAGFSVVSLAPSGCPGGILLEASFLASGNVSVGHGSSITAALTEGQQAVFKLYDYSRSGTGVRVTSMRCM